MRPPPARGHAGHMNESTPVLTRSVTPRQLSWLRTELADWTAAGIITPDQADDIAKRRERDT